MVSVAAVELAGDEAVAEAEGGGAERVGRHRVDGDVVARVEAASLQSQIKHLNRGLNDSSSMDHSIRYPFTHRPSELSALQTYGMEPGLNMIHSNFEEPHKILYNSTISMTDLLFSRRMRLEHRPNLCIEPRCHNSSFS